MLMKSKLLGSILLAAFLAGCTDDPAATVEEKRPTDHLTDSELITAADPAAAAVEPAWATYLANNHFVLRSLSSSDFSDLQFFKTVLGNKRIVQLGESGHGVSEFNSAKVRLIKFLHEEMGFDVIAFESSVYECFQANANATNLSGLLLMQNCIFGVWHAAEVVPLFDYIKSTRATARPLQLAGFDTQISSFSGSRGRARWFQEVIGKIDADYAARTFVFDSTFLAEQGRGASFTNYATTNRAQLTARWDSIADYLTRNMDRLVTAHAGSATQPRLARQTAISMSRFVNQLATTGIERTVWRDEGMADNLDFLLNTLHPGKKVIVWAHNFHIRHDNAAFTPGVQPPTMGKWVAERHRSDLYTIGLYMYRGQAADNTRAVYTVRPPSPNSLEALAYTARKRWIFFDLASAPRTSGTEWMYSTIPSKSWGVNDERAVLRNQYDGILFIDTVQPPNYIR